MKKYLILFAVIFLLCCSEKEVLSIDVLKQNGYKEVSCKSIESYQDSNNSYIEINEKLQNKKSYILARCFDKESCLLNLTFDKDKIICQRYVIDKATEDKRDYLNDEYKEFLNHRVFYLVLNNDEKIELIKRVN